MIGCSNQPEPKYIHGKVLSKEVEPSRTETQVTTMMGQPWFGKGMPIARTQTIPETYIIHIEVTSSKVLRVTKEEYEKAVVGKNITLMR